MPDLTAGTQLLAADLPAPQVDREGAQILDIGTGYTAGSPTCAVTFTAPTSGRVKLIVGAGMRDSAGSGRVAVAPHVVNEDTGVVFLSASASGYGLTSTAGTLYEFASRVAWLEGLDAGATYSAELRHRAFGASSQDIRGRSIIAVPLT